MEFYSELGVIHNSLLDDNKHYLMSIENNGTDVNFKTISKEEAYDLIFIEVKNNMSENYNFNHEELLVNAKDLAFDRFYDIVAFKMQKSKDNAFSSDFEQVILDLEKEELLPDYASEVFNNLVQIVSGSPEYIEQALDTYLQTEIDKDVSIDKINFIMLCNSVTLNSAEYWNDYLGKTGYSAKEKQLALPGWAIADIAGAIVGGGTAIIMQWGDINWWKVGANSLWVGAAGSGLKWLIK